MATPQGSRAGYLSEVQGLRTLALSMVAAFHIWGTTASGGVDVFLMLSAFFITRSVLKHSSDPGWRFNPISFLAKRFARLLPLAATTIALTLAAAIAIFPPWRWPAVFESAWMSLTYRQNLLLQERHIDYFAVDPNVLSPFQHFWSLSVQGQVFVLWALLHLIALLAARLTRTQLRWWLFAGFGLLFLVSLAWATIKVDGSPLPTYYDTPARLWEFAFGSLLAVTGPLRLPRAWIAPLQYIGLIMVLSTAFVLPAGAQFPGPAALWPLCGAALIVMSARPGEPGARILTNRWALKGGEFSYALYLVHWPVLVFTQAVLGASRLGVLAGVLVLIASLLLSALLVALLERPSVTFQRRSPRLWRPAAISVLSVAVVSGLIPIASAATSARYEADPGARAHQDWATLGQECAVQLRPGIPCSETAPATSVDQVRIAFLGNSHTQQFMPAFLEAYGPGASAEAHLLPGCVFREEPGTGRDILCHSLWEATRGGENLDQVDVVVLLGTVSTVDGDRVPAGLEDWVADVARNSDAEIILARDVPRFEENIFACGQQHPDSPMCEVELPATWDAPFEAPPGAKAVDLTSSICMEGTCRPAVQDQIVYLDSNHITAEFSRSLSDEVRHQIER